MRLQVITFALVGLLATAAIGQNAPAKPGTGTGAFAGKSKARMPDPPPPPTTDSFDCSRGTTFGGRFFPSLDDYALAIRVDPNDANAYYCRGAGRAMLGRYPAALNDLNVAVALTDDGNKHPVQAMLALWVRGALYEYLDNEEAAVADYTKALTYSPKNPDLLVTRADAEAQQQNLPSSLSDYNQAITLDAGNAAAYHGRSVVKRAMGDDSGAKADNDKALALGFRG